ncbi:MAG: choice-of-anchor J domain-containing protein [Prevotella sp.]|nr:choice-of-anchor J domain-containing protein [Prevotella sp.]
MKTLKTNLSTLLLSVLLLVPMSIMAQEDGSDNAAKCKTRQVEPSAKSLTELTVKSERDVSDKGSTERWGRKAVDSQKKDAPKKAVKEVNFIACMASNSLFTGQSKNGIYSFSTTSLTPNLISQDDRLRADAGGAFVGTKLYYQRRYTEGVPVRCFEYNMLTNTFEAEAVERGYQGYMATVGTAYDKSTGRGYGVYYHDSGYPYEFAYIDYNTWERVKVADIDMNNWVAPAAMAADNSGNLYAIGDNDGALYSVNKTTGKFTKIGDTGFNIGLGVHRACIDSRFNKLYMVGKIGDGTSHIIEVDLQTGAGTDIGKLSGGLDAYVIAVEELEADANAPMGVMNFKAENTLQNMYDFSVSFKLPTKTFAGNTLSGTVTYELFVDGESHKTGSGSVGQNVNLTLSSLSGGMHELSVVVRNNAGESPEDRYQIWSGPDNTAAPKNAHLVINGNKATVTWEAPEMKGVHGGLVDPSKVTYALMQLPEQTIVAQDLTSTSWTGTIDANKLRFYTYLVISVHQGMQSATANTETIKVGEYIEPPYFENFSDFNTIYLYTVLDSNDDGCSWGIGNQNEVGYIYSETNRADDWLITPKLKLQAGKKYKFSFKASCDNENFPERMEVKMGKAATAEGMTTELFAPFMLTSANYKTFDTEFTVDSDDFYYIGFHAISDAFCYYIWMTDLSIEVADEDAPAAPEVTIENAPYGNLSTTLHVTVPSTTAKGQPLSNVSKVEVIRLDDNKQIKVVNNPAPGSTFDANDTFQSEGKYTYSVVAYNTVGRGEAAIVSTFVGKDMAAAPKNLRVVDNGDDTALIMWDAADGIGANGGYADPAEVMFHVYPVNNGYIGQYIADISENMFDPQLSGIDSGEMRLYQYMVSAYNILGESEKVIAALVAGEKEQLPYNETFPSRSTDGFWYFDRAGNADFGFSTESSNGDGGSISLTASQKGDKVTIISGKIDMSSAVNPKLVYHYYAKPGDDAKLVVEANVEQSTEPEVVLQTIDLKTLSGQEGWREEIVDLSDMAGASYILLKFGINANAAANVLVDDVKVYSTQSNDFAATSIMAPMAAKVNNDISVVVQVENLSEETSSDYTVQLFATYEREDGFGQMNTRELLLDEQEGRELEAFVGTTQYTFNVAPTAAWAEKVTLKAVVKSDVDKNKANNTAAADLVVVQNDLPAIDDLTADISADPVVKLNWTAPEVPTVNLPKTVTEDFEDTSVFPAYSVGGVSETQKSGSFGDWKLYDGDGMLTYFWQNAGSYDNAGKQMAWQVMNPNGVFDLDQAPQFAAHSGNQYLISVCPALSATVGNASSDWLISPELSGQQQAITFYVKESTTTYGAETYDVLYSTTDSELSSFEYLESFSTITTAWTQNVVLLPAGTKHFAIRHTSFDVMGMFLDDISYEVSSDEITTLPVAGYRIYVDDECIAESTSLTTEYVTQALSQNGHTINVTVLYGDDKLESPLSNTARVLTAIDETVAEDGIMAADVVVYNTAGQVVADGKNAVKTLPQGIYVVRNKANGKTMKIRR